MNTQQEPLSAPRIETGGEIVCRIGDNAYGGEGIARVGGMVVFVKGAFRGETVRAKVRQVKKRFAKADFAELLEPSKEIPRLPRFDAVPGMV